MLAHGSQCAVMGTGGVGKSSITVRFVNGSYLESYDPTSESAYSQRVARGLWAETTLLSVEDSCG